MTKIKALTAIIGIGTVIMVVGNLAALVTTAKIGAAVVFAGFVALGLDTLINT